MHPQKPASNEASGESISRFLRDGFQKYTALLVEITWSRFWLLAFKEFPSPLPTTTSTSLVAFPNPLGMLLSALCVIGSGTMFLRNRRTLRKD